MATLRKYIKIKPQKEEKADNDIRISANGQAGSYIAYAARLLLHENQNQQFDTVSIKASGPAIAKACKVSEILRQRIEGLAQISKIYSKSIEDKFEPTEEGLDTVIIQRQLTVLEIVLTTKPSEEDKKDIGYQEPLPKDQIKAFPHNFGGGFRRGTGERREGGDRRGGRGRGGRMRRGRGGPRGERREDREYDDRREQSRGGDRSRERDYKDRREDRGDREGGYRRGGRRGGRRGDGGYRRGEGGYRRGDGEYRRGGDRGDRDRKN